MDISELRDNDRTRRRGRTRPPVDIDELRRHPTVPDHVRESLLRRCRSAEFAYELVDRRKKLVEMLASAEKYAGHADAARAAAVRRIADGQLDAVGDVVEASEESVRHRVRAQALAEAVAMLPERADSSAFGVPEPGAAHVPRDLVVEELEVMAADGDPWACRVVAECRGLDWRRCGSVDELIRLVAG